MIDDTGGIDQRIELRAVLKGLGVARRPGETALSFALRGHAELMSLLAASKRCMALEMRRAWLAGSVAAVLGHAEESAEGVPDRARLKLPTLPERDGQAAKLRAEWRKAKAERDRRNRKQHQEKP